MKRMIWIWPDGTWCDEDERHEMTHKSDDCSRVEVPDDVLDVDAWVQQHKLVRRP